MNKQKILILYLIISILAGYISLYCFNIGSLPENYCIEDISFIQRLLAGLFFYAPIFAFIIMRFNSRLEQYLFSFVFAIYYFFYFFIDLMRGVFITKNPISDVTFWGYFFVFIGFVYFAAFIARLFLNKDIKQNQNYIISKLNLFFVGFLLLSVSVIYLYTVKRYFVKEMIDDNTIIVLKDNTKLKGKLLTQGNKYFYLMQSNGVLKIDKNLFVAMEHKKKEK